jgi:hypothetical protein
MNKRTVRRGQRVLSPGQRILVVARRRKTRPAPPPPPPLTSLTSPPPLKSLTSPSMVLDLPPLSSLSTGNDRKLGGGCLMIKMQGKSHLCLSFLGIARPQSQFPHSCVCERFIFSQDWSTYFLQQKRQTDPGNIYCKSLTDI